VATTALPPLAEVEDLRAWPGVSVSDDQESAAEAVLSRASAIVRRAAGKTWLNDDGSGLGDVPDGISSIVVQAAARFWNNPNGAVAITKGPFSEQFGQAVEAGVFLTQSEKDEISDAVSISGSRPKLWTQATTRDRCGADGVFLTDQYDGDPILYGGAVDPGY
jgi:hypothetical protein